MSRSRDTGSPSARRVTVKQTAFLALEDGTIFEGVSAGAPGVRVGEVVFNTATTGYQEILTDPSYARQLVTLTNRSEEHTSELQSLMRISYAVFCLKKKNTPTNTKKRAK